MNLIASLLCGLLFGAGLLVSGMADPAKVLGFLDLAGRWDPSLMLVMAAAVLTALPAFALARRRSQAILELPASRRIDARLIVGSLIFGVGWGIAGFCPGPAIVSLGMGQWQPVLFVAAMLIGRAAYEVVEHLRQAS